MDLLRSESMQLAQLNIPIEAAHRTISYLGDLGLFQFKDLNAEKSPFQRTYAAQMKRCGEMACKLRFCREQMTKAGLLLPAWSSRSDGIDLDSLEVKPGELESELVEMNANHEKLQQNVGLVHQRNVLQTIGYQFEHWNLLVKKEKSIYHTLNMLSIDVTRKCLVAEGWCPVFATSQIQNTLQRAMIDSNAPIGSIFHVLQTKESPPTYFRTNKFTSAFQEIVDAYG
ncbi:hypothetical protein SLA2020_152180 [Shorea laevis]